MVCTKTARVFGKNYHPSVSDIVFKNFQVNVCLISVSSDEKGVKLALVNGRSQPQKWISNRDKVMETTPEVDKLKA